MIPDGTMSYSLPDAGEEPTPDDAKKEMRMQASKSNRKQIDVSEMLKGWPEELIKKLDEDDDGVITWDDIRNAVTKRADAESQAVRMKRIVIALVVTVCGIVALNSAATVASLEMTKESFVNRHQLVDASGEKVRVSSSDMGVKADGQICPLNDSGECVPDAVVLTGEARSVANLFDLPLFDSQTLARLRELHVPLQDGQELTLTVTGSMKHKGGKSATFYGASGIKVTVDSASMTASAVVDGQVYAVDAPPQRLRRLQEGE